MPPARRSPWLKPFRRLTFHTVRTGLRLTGSLPLPAVFILGHMRCGSSLLLHILLSHPQLCGCGERNSAYHSPADLDRLALEARWLRRAPFRRYRHVIDQINHDKFTPNETLLRHPRVRLIFLAREPQPSISSLVELTKIFYREWSVTEAADYYVSRMRTLTAYAVNQPAGARAIALTYHDLMDNPVVTLRRLETFLNLESGLSQKYDLQSFTGTKGDCSALIQTGHIVRHRPRPLLTLPPLEMERTGNAFATWQSAMKRFG